MPPYRHTRKHSNQLVSQGPGIKMTGRVTVDKMLRALVYDDLTEQSMKAWSRWGRGERSQWNPEVLTVVGLTPEMYQALTWARFKRKWTITDDSREAG